MSCRTLRWTTLFSIFLHLSFACHTAYHRASSSNPDGTKKKRVSPPTSTNPPPTSTNPPSTSTNPPATSTNPPSTSTNPPATSTNLTATSTNPPPTSTNPPSTSTNPPSTSTNPPSTSTNPPSTSTNPPPTSTNPPPTTSPPPQVGGDTNITIQTFFPSCLANKMTTSDYQGRTWAGPVNYIIFHSRWYDRINASMCIGQNDTVECWADSVGTFIRRSSIAHRAAQECIVSYYETYHGTNYTLTEYSNGIEFEDAQNCASVDITTYEEEFRSDFDISDLEEEDLTLTDFGDFLQFAMDDMMCPDCSCEDMAYNDEYLEYYDYPDETTCGACWLTRLATETLGGSPFRQQMTKIAVKRGNLQQKTICPRPEIDFSDENAIFNLLGTNVTCSVKSVRVSMEACGFVALGYSNIEEVFFDDPSLDYDMGFIDEKCTPKLERRNGPDDRIVVFDFDKKDCNPYIGVNDTHTIYTYAIRNRDFNDTFVTDGIDRHVAVDINVTCVYSNYVLTLPFGIEALTRTIAINVPEQNSQLLLTMAAYKDPEFTQSFVSSNATISIPDSIWIRITHNSKNDIILQIDSCWVTPSLDPNDPNSIYIILGGCPVEDNNGTGSVDAATNLTTCLSGEASFGFASFSFSESETPLLLYIYCDVEVYTTSNPPCQSETCKTSSVSTTTRRRRNVNTWIEEVQLGLGINVENGNCLQNCNCEQLCLSCNSAEEHECGCFPNYVLQENGINCTRFT